MMYESCLWQDAYIVCYGELLPVFCLISSPTEGWASAQIFDEDLGVAAVAQLGDALLSDLSHALTCKTELVAYFLKALFLASYTEAFADDGYLSLFEHLAQYGIKLKGHGFVVYHAVGPAVLSTRHHVEHTVVFTVLEWGVDAHVVTVGSKRLSDLLFVELRYFRELGN